MALVKYRYAESNGSIVDIESVEKERGGNFICLSCGNALIPVLGEKRQNHFRHRTDVECSRETYLHNLAKRVFYDTYNQCLTDGSPFTIEYHGPKFCNYCAHHGPCTLKQTLHRRDLTKLFNQVEMELPVGDFIPDILLTNDKNDMLFIEFAVTHFSEKRKLMSGIRIVEVSIGSEDDIDLIRAKILSKLDARVKIMNFKVKPVRGDFLGECPQESSYFRLRKSGKSVIIGPVPTWQYDNLLRSGECVEKVKHPTSDSYIEMVYKYFKAGRHIKNCLLCRFHSIGSRTRKSYCKRKKSDIENLNCAVECNNFWINPPDKPDPTHNPLPETRITKRPAKSLSSLDVVTMKFFGWRQSCVSCQQPITFFTRITFESERLSKFSYDLHDASMSYYRFSDLKRALPKEFEKGMNIGRPTVGKCHLCEKRVLSLICPCCSVVQCEKMVMGSDGRILPGEVVLTQTIHLSGGESGIMDLLRTKAIL